MSRTPPETFPSAAPTRDGFGAGLLRAGRRDPRVVALDADLGESTRTRWFAEAFPERFFQMGISEQDMVVTAAGLASAGFIPFAATFAIFTQRAFEQFRNAVARTRLPVKLVGSHGGILTGEDGPSAQAISDVAIYRSLPHVTVVVPSDATQARNATEALASLEGPSYMKLTRAKVPKIYSDEAPFELGKAYTLREGSDISILACGALVSRALEAALLLEREGISTRVLDVPTIKPLDTEAILKAARETGRVVTAEDHNVLGGLGGAVAEVLSERYPVPLLRIGLKDEYAESGLPEELYEKYGLTPRHIAEGARLLWSRS